MAILATELEERRPDGVDRLAHLVETEAEFLTDPVLTEKSGEGSTAYCMETQTACIKKHDGFWYKQTDAGFVKIVGAESEAT